MKYKSIYDVINKSDCTYRNDLSKWMIPEEHKNYVESNRPLWIILENKRINKRIWVTHDFGVMEIVTAQLDLDAKTREYAESMRKFNFKNQSNMADKLKEILSVA